VLADAGSIPATSTNWRRWTDLSSPFFISTEGMYVARRHGCRCDDACVPRYRSYGASVYGLRPPLNLGLFKANILWIANKMPETFCTALRLQGQS